MALMLLVKEREILNKFQVLLKYGYDATNKFKKGGGGHNVMPLFTMQSYPYHTCISNTQIRFFEYTAYVLQLK